MTTVVWAHPNLDRCRDRLLQTAVGLAVALLASMTSLVT